MPTLIACSDALSKQFFVHKIGIHALRNYLALPVAYKPLMRTRTWLSSVFLPAVVQPGQHFEFKNSVETDFFLCSSFRTSRIQRRVCHLVRAVTQSTCYYLRYRHCALKRSITHSVRTRTPFSLPLERTSLFCCAVSKALSLNGTECHDHMCSTASKVQ
jgi:hypothetical protein